MRQDRFKSNMPTLEWKPGVAIPALMAGLVVQMFRIDQHRFVPAIWIEFAIFLIGSILAFKLLKRWVERAKGSVKPNTIIYLAQGSAAVVVLTLLTWQLISRNIGLGDANEMVALLMIQCLGWHLAVFSSVRGLERVSLLLCGAVVFFVCCMTTRTEILVFGSMFAVSALWWMAGIYWSRLDASAIDGNAKTLHIHGTSTAIGAGVIAIAMTAALLVPFSRQQISIAGFMPFSGGEEGYQDEFASSGVGDGDMLTAGSNATTTGAVDSDQFIEDDKPSMYDVITDEFDGPVFKKRLNRAVALDEVAKHIHDVKQSEQSGKTFRTMRNTDKELDIELEDRISKALFYVEGSVPVRFVVDSFQHFDGWDWTKCSIEGETPLPPEIKMRKGIGKPIFQLTRVKPDYLTVSRIHKFKVMRLQTPILPAPAFLNSWHISRVDNPNLFRWNDAGLVKFDGEAIPQHTVIDIKGHVPNYHVMRSMGDLRHGHRNNGSQNTLPLSSDPQSPFLQVPDTSSRQQIEELTTQCVAGIDPGWNQVEAIVNRMRKDFVLKRDWEVDNSTDDTVNHFLSQQGGPQWMFATSCAMMLRSAGYRTRLASGFLVQKKDYDRRARQSIATSGNLHMWPEVCLDGQYWIPLEPTPGFPVPFSTETTWQWMVAKAYNAFVWVWYNPLTSLSVLASVIWSYVYRAQVVTFLMLLWWHLVRFVWPRGLLRATRQLLDFRFWAAGDKRPISRTIKSWYTRVEPGVSTGFYNLWNAHNYGSQQHKVGRTELIDQCRAQIEVLSFKKIQNFVSEKSTMETS